MKKILTVSRIYRCVMTALAVVSASSCKTSGVNDKALSMTVHDLDNFDKMCWHELRLPPPKIDKLMDDTAQTALHGIYSYEYVEDERHIRSSIRLDYPKYFDWKTDERKGELVQIGDRVLVLGKGNSDDLRAWMVRIRGDWYLVQLDFPNGMVKLHKSTAGSH